MTKFNPNNKAELTYGETLSPAMTITDPKDAEQYLRDYVAFIQKYLDKEPNKEDKTAEEIAKSNLGYWAGYYDNATRERVERLFNCAHPVFGTIKDNGAPTPEQAFNAGKKLSEKQ